MSTPLTIPKLVQMKRDNTKITALTAYDYPFAKMADSAGIHILLVGDSLATVVQGHDTTLPATMDEMIYHTRMVARGTQQALVVGDMPFMSYQADTASAITNAGRFLKEAGAATVKLEGGAGVCDTIGAMVGAGIPVMAHIGLTPQSVHAMGGYRVQRDEDRLVADAQAVEAAGAWSVVLEGIPAPIAKIITDTVAIPTIGIGAGPDCDGQILVLHDLLGLTDRHVPKFVKQYAQLGTAAVKAMTSYAEEVADGRFPAEDHCY